MKVGVVVPGVTGRMGRLIAEAALDDDRHALVGATARPGSAAVGQDVAALYGRPEAGVLVQEHTEAALSALSPAVKSGAVLIDFTLPGLCAVHADVAMRHGLGLIVGTTGLSPDDEAALAEASAKVPVLVASNTSLGANLLMALTGQATRAIPEADVEIVELHHRGKRDAPSGTALSLARASAEARDQDLDEVKRTAREGIAPREAGEIGVFGVRGGDVPGEHTVYLFLEGERIELTHRVLSRRIFALGALRAARYLSGKPAGRYRMADVLGLG